MRACMRTFARLRMHACAYVCVHAYICVCVRVRGCTSVCQCARALACACVRACACARARACICLSVCVRAWRVVCVCMSTLYSLCMCRSASWWGCAVETRWSRTHTPSACAGAPAWRQQYNAHRCSHLSPCHLSPCHLSDSAALTTDVCASLPLRPTYGARREYHQATKVLRAGGAAIEMHSQGGRTEANDNVRLPVA